MNIPLLDVIKKVPKYVKFLKDLCTHKRRLKGNERDNTGRNVSPFIQPMHLLEKVKSDHNVSSLTHTMPQKCKDPRTFFIPCTIRDTKFKSCMLNLVASINFIYTSIYNNLDLGPLQNTCLMIQLENRSNALPVGVVKDALV